MLSGLLLEDVIKTNYELEAIQLYDTIYDHILKSMSRDVIGYEPSKWSTRTTATFLEKRIIFIEYREDNREQIRYIQTVKIVYR